MQDSKLSQELLFIQDFSTFSQSPIPPNEESSPSHKMTNNKLKVNELVLFNKEQLHDAIKKVSEKDQIRNSFAQNELKDLLKKLTKDQNMKEMIQKRNLISVQEMQTQTSLGPLSPKSQKSTKESLNGIKKNRVNFNATSGMLQRNSLKEAFNNTNLQKSQKELTINGIDVMMVDKIVPKKQGIKVLIEVHMNTQDVKQSTLSSFMSDGNNATMNSFQQLPQIYNQHKRNSSIKSVLIKDSSLQHQSLQSQNKTPTNGQIQTTKSIFSTFSPLNQNFKSTNDKSRLIKAGLSKDDVQFSKNFTLQKNTVCNLINNTLIRLKKQYNQDNKKIQVDNFKEETKNRSNYLKKIYDQKYLQKPMRVFSNQDRAQLDLSKIDESSTDQDYDKLQFNEDYYRQARGNPLQNKYLKKNYLYIQNADSSVQVSQQSILKPFDVSSKNSSPGLAIRRNNENRTMLRVKMSNSVSNSSFQNSMLMNEDLKPVESRSKNHRQSSNIFSHNHQYSASQIENQQSMINIQTPKVIFNQNKLRIDTNDKNQKLKSGGSLIRSPMIRINDQDIEACNESFLPVITFVEQSKVNKRTRNTADDYKREMQSLKNFQPPNHQLSQLEKKVREKCLSQHNQKLNEIFRQKYRTQDNSETRLSIKVNKQSSAVFKINTIQS
ncbi:UNKNOWN [Stylonychia lemnae]|uniref:Uncharacterized protein n=1 Tax=Stylonychia lemnae TaxID=5949 RepID=A0A078AHT8_STYLE|nr:UNKNOWN [Stylonychia lemnae]|eukprot:CDW81067.1 UNKNOWN [Stylonychia lemnae]